MSAPIVAFFNNKGGVGKTSLVYHLAWKLADLGLDVLAADLDPQANLTSAFLSEPACEKLWSDESAPSTIFSAIAPLRDGTGDIQLIPPTVVSRRVRLLPGDLELSVFEDDLADAWGKMLSDKPREARVTSAFYRLIRKTAEASPTSIVLLDVGPSLGALNRAALIAADFVVIPVGADLFSVQALRNVGPRLRTWREEWGKRHGEQKTTKLALPEGRMQPIGYVLIQHRYTKAYSRWASRLPIEYAEHVQVDDEPCLAQIRHYLSLMPMAQEARKPIFHLTPADGAIGAHFQAARAAGTEFGALADSIRKRIGL